MSSVMPFLSRSLSPAMHSRTFSGIGEEHHSQAQSSEQRHDGVDMPRLRRWLAALPELNSGDDIAIAAEQLINTTLRTLPLPGHGDTITRLNALLEIAAHDLCLARCVESHLDAAAMLAEAGRPLHLHYAAAIPLHGVWSGRHPDQALEVTEHDDGLELNGVLPFCAGAMHLSQCLIAATIHGERTHGERTHGEQVLLQAGVHELPMVAHNAWHNAGLRRMPSGSFIFDGFMLAKDRMVGPPGFHHSRRGFWAGAILHAACGLGAAMGIVRRWRGLMLCGATDSVATAHLAASVTVIDAAWAQLQRAAHSIDDADIDNAQLKSIALCVRHSVERACDAVLSRVGRALGPVPLIYSKTLAAQSADLQLHVRQCHAENELGALGTLLLDEMHEPSRWHAWL